MTLKNESPVWAIKYRPVRIDDMVLSQDRRDFFNSIVNNKKPMTILLSGPPGNGKTTTALAIVKSMGAEYIFLNGSGKDRGIDTVKGKIEYFAKTMSLDGSKKVIIYDEADSITADAQLALRSVIESVADNCTFILTANYPSKIIDPLVSRCHQVDLTMERNKDSLSQIAKYCVRILNTENIEYSKAAIIEIVKANFPDIRRIVNSLQEHSMDGKITSDDAIAISKTSTSEFFNVLRSKKFKNMHEWVFKNVREPDTIVEMMWANLNSLVTAKTQPYAVVHLDDCQDRMTRVANKHITLVATCAKIMSDCEFVDG